MNLPPIRKPNDQRDMMRCLWELCDRVEKLQLQQSPTVDIKQTEHGVLANVNNLAVGGGSSIGLYVVTAVKRDWLECAPCKIDPETSAPVYSTSGRARIVAKPLSLRPWYFLNGGMDGLVYELVFDGSDGAGNPATPPTDTRDYSGQTRRVWRIAASEKLQTDLPDTAGPQFTEIVYPSYLTASQSVHGSIIVAAKVPYSLRIHETDKPDIYSEWIDLNVCGRTWMEAHYRFTVCDPAKPSTDPTAGGAKMIRASTFY